MTTRDAPGNPYADDPDEVLSDSSWEDGIPEPQEPQSPKPASH